MPQFNQSGWMNSPLFCPFVLFRPSTDWMMPTHIEEGNLHYSLPIHVLISSRNTLTETMFKQISGHPKTNDFWHTKLTVTGSEFTITQSHKQTLVDYMPWQLRKSKCQFGRKLLGVDVGSMIKGSSNPSMLALFGWKHLQPNIIMHALWFGCFPILASKVKQMQSTWI